MGPARAWERCFKSATFPARRPLRPGVRSKPFRAPAGDLANEHTSTDHAEHVAQTARRLWANAGGPFKVAFSASAVSGLNH
ncbi:MAG: hypothetical protein GX495_11245 [Chloroflexi bacterium]|nr:hypothetical protein [Chloroflexota bacterium]